MTSRRDKSDPLYGQIRLRCPRGHDMGAITAQPRQSPKHFFQTERLMRTNDDGVSGAAILRGDPIAVTCTICARDFEEKWDMIEPILAQLRDSPVVTFTVHAAPLC